VHCCAHLPSSITTIYHGHSRLPSGTKQTNNERFSYICSDSASVSPIRRTAFNPKCSRHVTDTKFGQNISHVITRRSSGIIYIRDDDSVLHQVWNNLERAFNIHIHSRTLQVPHVHSPWPLQRTGDEFQLSKLCDKINFTIQICPAPLSSQITILPIKSLKTNTSTIFLQVSQLPLWLPFWFIMMHGEYNVKYCLLPLVDGSSIQYVSSASTWTAIWKIFKEP
jgi:hypothetical protein